jgi:hypothetical protein
LLIALLFDAALQTNVGCIRERWCSKELVGLKNR